MKIQKTINVLATIMFAALLSSCGNSAKEESIKEKLIKASGISISGDGSNYIKVVDGDYTLKVVGDKIVIPVKFELVEKYEGKDEPHMSSLSLVPIDTSGDAIPDIGLNFEPATMSDWDKIKDLLKGDVGKTVTISFQGNYYLKGKVVQDRIMKETESFEITDADITIKSLDEGSTDNKKDNSSETSSSGSENYDKVLEDYAVYVDDYLKIMKKVNKGDQTAIAEYPALMEKAQTLSESLRKAQDANSLSASQIKKMTKIQTKMMNAALEMQKK